MSVYNAGEYLAASIESILDQTLKDFEFIIVDDCSTDNSSEILRRYQQRDTRIKTIENDGYRALQVTAGTRRASRINKPTAGHLYGGS